LSKHRYIPEACGFLQPARRGETAIRLAKTLPTRSRHAVIASVLALYPSTTTEIPFT
jgi:hypothetical protein